MDSVVKVRRSFLNRLRGLCNALSSMCDGCYRASCDCFMANEIHRAKELMREIDDVRDAEEERFYVSNPAEEFMARVESAIRQGGGKNVRSDEIKTFGESRQRKARALKALMRRGRISKTVVDGIPFYSIKDWKNKNNKHKGERHGV